MDLAAETQRLAALLALAEAELAAATQENAKLLARAEAAEEAAARLQRDLDLLKRRLQGPSSERLVDPNQLPLPGIDLVVYRKEGQADNEPSKGEKRERNKKRRQSSGRRSVEEMDHLPIHEHVRLVDERNCACCGVEAVHLGFDVSWRLERIPAKIIRHKILQEKVVFPHGSETGGSTVVTAPCPVSYALPKALCGNGLLAEIVLSKYADHLPLYRQEERFRREGLELSRQTMCDWVMDLADLLSPITGWMELALRAQPWLRADATSMRVMDPGRVKGRTHVGHIWAWGNYDTVVFSYTADKRGHTVAGLFEGFSGLLLIDGATDFNLLEKADGVTRAGCWAHARRYLYEALPYDSRLALAGLAAIRELFMAERVVMGTPLAERLALRRELCEPIVQGIRKWVDEELPRQVPKSPTHRALQYLDNQWKRLVVFLERPEIACHNNDTERDLRRPVKGKANFHFAGSPRGARAMAIYYSLIGTCLLQGIDPRRYFEEILGRLDEPPSRLTPQAVREQWLAAQGA